VTYLGYKWLHLHMPNSAAWFDLFLIIGITFCLMRTCQHEHSQIVNLLTDGRNEEVNMLIFMKREQV